MLSKIKVRKIYTEVLDFADNHSGLQKRKGYRSEIWGAHSKWQRFKLWSTGLWCHVVGYIFGMTML